VKPAVVLLAAALLGCAQGPGLAPTHSTPGRPQLDAATAARQTVADYLAQGATPWAPGEVQVGKPDFIVAADGSGTHRTLQAAIAALPARNAGARRWTIQLQPGVYREVVCARDKAPFTLTGMPGDPAAVVVVAGRYNAQRKAPGEAGGPCDPAPGAPTWGTPGSASVAILSDDVQLAHLSIANDAMERVRDGIGYPEGAGESGGAQGVALRVQGDRILMDGVRLVGHQDTLMAGGGRVLVRHSVIAGDVDFIFGDATLVITDSSILSRGGRRKPGNGGHVLAPSTAHDQRLGFLVVNSRFLAEPGVAPASFSLGRAWDFAVPQGQWKPNESPNGQALVRNSRLGGHIAPWSASTSRRPFSAEGPLANRMAEFGNVQFEADPAREVLAANDGWGAAGGGTQGGAAALPADVSVVRNRAELAAALQPHEPSKERPRIVKVVGRIDLSVDAQNRPLGFEQFRDPAFDWDAYAKVYDPATWGKLLPRGPLEEARQRSAKKQAQVVVLRVPSRTTLIGVGAGAGFVNGTLFLDKVSDVIVRKLHFSDAFDHFPLWDPNDNASGEWNSEYDNLTLRGATRVWVDHCTFDDGERPDLRARVLLGKHLQHHDGLLDITQQSNHVTVSWNHFRRHDKTSLVGSSDGQKLDEGRLKVTFHHNLWEQTKERSPRVRYGQVHVYNNLYIGRTDELHPYGYSLGLGFRSRIVSERNVWETDAPAGRLLRWFKAESFLDQGSLLNGRPVDLLGALRQANPQAASVNTEVGWKPWLVGTFDESAEVAAKVRAGAGAPR
jgi:pectate lyase/pectin methylesterase-like acyl-CoA thioesterase